MTLLFCAWEGCTCTHVVASEADVPKVCPKHGGPLHPTAPARVTPGTSTNLGFIAGEVEVSS